MHFSDDHHTSQIIEKEKFHPSWAEWWPLKLLSYPITTEYDSLWTDRVFQEVVRLK